MMTTSAYGRIALLLGVTASMANAATATSIAQIASAGGWDTTLTIVSLNASPAEPVLSFFDQSGNPLVLPFTFPQGSMPPQTTSKIDGSVNAHGVLLVDTTGPSWKDANVGWSLLQGLGSMNGYALFTNTPNNWQAAVPLETRNASSYVLAFDNTNTGTPLSTGVAIANLSSQSAGINVIIRDDSGATIDTETLQMAAQGHASFTLASTYHVTDGIRGTVEFDTPAGGQINVLGLRAHGPALTTLPLLAEVGVNGGSMAHVTYNQGWQTNITLVNTGTSSAKATLSFFDDSGTPVPMSLTFPQTGAVSNSSVVTETLAPGASVIMETNGHGGYKSVTGSALLATTGNVSGFAIFRYDPSQQEAVVPLESRNSSSYTVVYDNTNGIETGLAIANATAQAITLNLIVRDDTGAEIKAGILPLAAHGHTSMILSKAYEGTKGIRGTVEIDALSGGQFSALGLRFTPGQNVTTIPVLAK